MSSKDDDVIQVSPPSPEALRLREKYIDSFASQSERMDSLGFRLITLELAIPGLFVAVLRSVYGKGVTIPVNGWLYVGFTFWTLALLVTMWAIFPKGYEVDSTVVDKKSTDITGLEGRPPLGIKEFFRVSADYKRIRLGVAILFFWGGLLCSLVSLVG